MIGPATRNAGSRPFFGASAAHGRDLLDDRFADRHREYLLVGLAAGESRLYRHQPSELGPDRFPPGGKEPPDRLPVARAPGVEQGADLDEPEPERDQVADRHTAADLVEGVGAVPGAEVFPGGHEQPALVVEAKRPLREPGHAGEGPDRDPFGGHGGTTLVGAPGR